MPPAPVAPNPPDFAIVIVNWNTRDPLVGCLEHPQVRTASAPASRSRTAHGKARSATAWYASTVLPGFWLQVEWLWQDPLPPVLDVLRALGVI